VLIKIIILATIVKIKIEKPDKAVVKEYKGTISIHQFILRQ
jgi:hypothetical protein